MIAKTSKFDKNIQVPAHRKMRQASLGALTPRAFDYSWVKNIGAFGIMAPWPNRRPGFLKIFEECSQDNETSKDSSNEPSKLIGLHFFKNPIS